MNIEIRLATVQDVPAILAIRKEGKLSEYKGSVHNITDEDILKTDLDGPAVFQKWTDRINEPDRYRTWVAEIEGQIVGTGSVRREGGGWMLYGLFVKSDLRGRGIGTRLVQTRLNWLGDNVSVVIKVTEHNLGRLNYTKYGFTPSETITSHTIPGKPFQTVILTRPANT